MKTIAFLSSKSPPQYKQFPYYSMLIGKNAHLGNPIPVDGTAKIGVTGKSDMPFNIMQPSLGLNYIICLEGIYPSRNYSELLNL